MTTEPEVLATVGGIEYITGVSTRERGEPPRYYCSIEEWEGSPMAKLAEAEREITRLIEDRTRGEQKIAELIERNRQQEATIQRGRNELERLQQEVAQLRAAQEVAAPTAEQQVAAPRKHDRKAGETIPCGVEGCAEALVAGTSMAQHRRRKHAAWYAEQMAMEITDPRYVPNRGGPLPTIVPITLEEPKLNQERVFKEQFISLERRFECSACHTDVHAAHPTDQEGRCIRCVKEDRHANGVAAVA